MKMLRIIIESQKGALFLIQTFVNKEARQLTVQNVSHIYKCIAKFLKASKSLKLCFFTPTKI